MKNIIYFCLFSVLLTKMKWSLLFSINMFGILVFLHELGHFIVAKIIGIPVNIFSLGFGPKIVSFFWKDTDIRLSLLPCGGYVQISEDEIKTSKILSTWKGLFFYASGILVNIITTLIILTSLNLFNSYRKSNSCIITNVNKQDLAYREGLRSGDEICNIDNIICSHNNIPNIVQHIRAKPDDFFSLTIKRKGYNDPVKVLLKSNCYLDRFIIASNQDSKKNNGLQALLKCTRKATIDSFNIASETLKSIGLLLSGRINVKQVVGGPITIIRYGDKMICYSLEHFLYFIATVSMSLAIFNALPLPILDGGRIVILLLEKLYGKSLSNRGKEFIVVISLLILLPFFCFVVVNDILKIYR